MKNKGYNVIYFLTATPHLFQQGVTDTQKKFRG